MATIISLSVSDGPIPVHDILHRAGIVLQDEDHVRWTADELIGWVNEAAGMVVTLKPDAGARVATMELEPGAQQSVSGVAVQQIDVLYNVSPEDKPGRAIRLTERHLLDSADPDWYGRKPGKAIKHYTYDDRTPSLFFVYPPAAAGARVRASLSVIPDPVSTVSDHLGMGIQYSAALLNYVLFRCFSKESEFANGTLSAAYYEAFKDVLGLTHQAETMTSPNAKEPA